MNNALNSIYETILGEHSILIQLRNGEGLKLNIVN